MCFGPPNGYTFFCAYVPGLTPLPVTGGGLFSLLIFSAKIYPSHLELSLSGVTSQAMGPTVSSSASGLQALAA